VYSAIRALIVFVNLFLPGSKYQKNTVKHREKKQH
jgi:hypothetical protein